jgi:phenylpropionate dioxygenase-like ring-hydroxylating dioxygenase large terminal subunit
MERAESQHLPPGIPNGWFAVSWSKDLIEGEVKRVRSFDRELVLFRTRTGQARLLDAYCPHLGAHLAEGGRVVGEALRCPFHGWQYDGASGVCVEIPYCERIPAKARVRAWEVVELNQMIFAWHHTQEKSPSWEIPEVPELSHPDWTEPRTIELEVPVHMQDMAENNCDPVHFKHVHGLEEMPPSEVSYAEDGRFFKAISEGERELPDGSKIKTRLVRDTWGLGISSVYIEGVPGVGLYMFSSTTPVDQQNTISRWIFTVTKNMADIAGEDFIQNLSTGVLQDMRIWKNKIHRAQPVFCEADELLVDFRRWTRQFYSESA